MTNNFIQQITHYFGNYFLDKSSSILNENPNQIKNGISAIIPSIFASILQRGNQGGMDIAQILNSIPENQYNNLDNALEQLQPASNNELLASSSSWISQIFGDKIGNLTKGISNFSALKSSTITTLIAAVVPYALSFFKKYTREHSLHSNGDIMNFLKDERVNIAAATPSGFDLPSILGFNSSTDYADRPLVHESAKSQSGWATWLIFLAAGGLLLWFLMRGCEKNEPTIAPATTDTVPAKADTKNVAATTPAGKGTLDNAGNWVADWGTDKNLELPDGTVLKVGEHSTEYKLYQFITSDFTIDSVNKNLNWISFDRVYFETNKSVLTAESKNQIANIAKILQNYPKAGIKIGGYTDNTGDMNTNTKLSRERAEIVAGELVKAGAAKEQVMEANGYGPEFPIASNESAEGRAQNRRVDLKLGMK